MNALPSVNVRPGQSEWTLSKNIGNFLDEISSDEPTILSNADAVGGVITISASGIYRLSEELTNRVQINVDKVSLDLNGYGISLSAAADSGVTIQSDRKKIVVRNGYVENSAASPTVDGISAVSASGDTISAVHLDNVKVFGFDSGIYFEAQAGGVVKNCYITDCSCADANSHGFEALGSGAECLSFTNCVASDNGSRGFSFYTSYRNLFNNCEASANGAQGFFFDSSSYNVFNYCVAQNNNNNGFHFINTSSYNFFYNCVSSYSVTDDGFYFYSSSNHNVLEKCVSLENSDDGFSFDSSVLNVLEKCVASNNGDEGFLFSGSSTSNVIRKCVSSNNSDDGFLFSSSSDDNILKECISSDNSDGFYFTTSTDNFLDECTASNNTTSNYNGLTNNNTFRCRDVVNGSPVSWQDTAANGGWTARG